MASKNSHSLQSHNEREKKTKQIENNIKFFFLPLQAHSIAPPFPMDQESNQDRKTSHQDQSNGFFEIAQKNRQTHTHTHRMD